MAEQFDLVSRIHDANPKRNMDIFARRVIKLGEEYGEAAQAYLSISSENNSKNKSWEDVREELVDVLIVAMDLFLHQMPDEKEGGLEAKKEVLTRLVNRKLKKWQKKQERRDDTSE
jgi:NTP pyrophosphatase (non-canonical NTP hydrolase)